jgi:phosphatidylserine decarboxylase
VALEEAEFPLAHYRNLAQFFTRRLKENARPIQGPLVSPIDGFLRGVGTVSSGTILQVKGRPYRVADLLGDELEATKFEGGAFFNFYLSPRDYHRIHLPCQGAIRSLRHLPGKLWPVNQWAVQNVERLFAVNERVVLSLTTPYGEVAVVMIGALNVGGISVPFDHIQTNRWYWPWQRPAEHFIQYDPPKSFNAGAEVGTFHMGSAVVLLFPPGVSPEQLPDGGQSVRMGEALRVRLP